MEHPVAAGTDSVTIPGVRLWGRCRIDHQVESTEFDFGVDQPIRSSRQRIRPIDDVAASIPPFQPDDGFYVPGLSVYCAEKRYFLPEYIQRSEN